MALQKPGLTNFFFFFFFGSDIGWNQLKALRLSTQQTQMGSMGRNFTSRATPHHQPPT